MPEQPKWSERTLDMPPQDPWADQPTTPGPPVPGTPEPTAHQPTMHQPASHQPTTHQPTTHQPTTHQPTTHQPVDQSPFSRGRAQVNPRTQRFAAEHEPTGTGWPGAEAPSHRGMSWRWSELRRGGEWTSAAVLFAFVCWGIWAISEGGSLVTPAIVFLVTLAVAAGLFCLCRFVGHLVLERQMGRVRRTARGSHLMTALFLAGVGLTHLQQTEWVMTAVNWLRGQAG